MSQHAGPYNEPQTTPSPPRAASGGCGPNAKARNKAHALSVFEPGQTTAIPLAYGAFCAAYDSCMAGYFFIRRAHWNAAWLEVLEDIRKVQIFKYRIISLHEWHKR